MITETLTNYHKFPDSGTEESLERKRGERKKSKQIKITRPSENHKETKPVYLLIPMRSLKRNA